MPDAIPEGHPSGLYMMFFAELWERFCFYGMRALLAIYVAQLFMVAQADAALVYGAYTSLVYATGIFGGYVADRVLGFRRSILLGGLVMAAGEFMLIVYDQSAFLVGLAMIVVGNGLFKPNISSLVGKLYKQNDPRRDSGFTIFYMGINIGALIAPLLCGGISNLFPRQVPLDQLPPGMPVEAAWQEQGYALLPDYRWGFGLAGVGMLVGLVTFYLGRHRLGDKGLAPQGREGAGPILKVLVGCAIFVPAVYLLIANEEVAGYILLAMAMVIIAYLAGFAVKQIRAGEKPMGHRIFALLILLFANTVFWSCFEQAGNSLNFFAKNNLERQITLGFVEFEFLFEWFQSVNPAYIVLLAPLFATLWLKLEKRGLNPSIPRKFGLGLVQVGLGFGVLLLGMGMADSAGKVPFLILMLLYLLHTTGELCLSPVGLSMVTKLAPAHMTGLVMGAWFLSISCANYLAGVISFFAGGGGEGESETATGEAALEAYRNTFTFVFWYAVGAGVLLLLLSKKIDKLMHGIK